MRSFGIVPAGGNASRFDGLAKELLPVAQDECALVRCIRAIPAEETIVFTSADKYPLHHKAVMNMPNVHLISGHFNNLAGAIAAGIGTKEANWYYFAMPDTVFPVDAFPTPTHPVMCGIFYTKEPERFGVLRGSGIVDKQPGDPGLAWGAWIWSRGAALDLADACREMHDYTAALNVMLTRWSMDTFPLRYYYDFASFRDYKKFLQEN